MVKARCSGGQSLGILTGWAHPPWRAGGHAWRRGEAPGVRRPAARRMPAQSVLSVPGTASTVSPAIFHWPSTFTQSSCFFTVSR